MSVFTHVCSTYVHVCVYNDIHICLHVYVCIYMCYMCMYVCMCVHVYVCTYMCMYVCMYVCTNPQKILDLVFPLFFLFLQLIKKILLQTVLLVEGSGREMVGGGGVMVGR